MLQQLRSLVMLCAVLGVLLLLTACGGGGKGDMARMPAPPDPPPMLVASIESTSSEPTAERVTAYLHAHATGGPWRNSPTTTWQHDPGLVRFPVPPTLRVAEGTTSHERALVHHAVAVLNRELPYDQHIQIGQDAPSLAALASIPRNQIFIDFAPYADWNDPNKSGPSGGAAEIDVAYRYDTEQQRHEKQVMNRAHIWLLPREELGDDRTALYVLLHEGLHALGLHGHLDEDDFSDSVLRDLTWLPTSGLPAIDGTALRTLYTRYPVATEPEAVSVNSLGPWDQEATSFVGRFGDLTFGVTHHNGFVRPWTQGIWPSTDLADNQALSGTVTWSGGLVGFTPTQAPVRGAADLSVHLGTLTGDADFTELQSWSAGTTSTMLGTGTRWKTGTLSYDIAVSGNFLRNTGGDAGILSGTFSGPTHEGVVGTLDRADLTAAFGARR